MSVGDLIFWLVFIILIYDILIKIINLVKENKYYKIPKDIDKIKEYKTVTFEEFDSILDEEDLKDLRDDELISFNEIKESDLTNED